MGASDSLEELSLVAPVNQRDLANSVGSVRAVVARILQELRAASLVRTSPGLVEIIDPVGMSRELWSRKVSPFLFTSYIQPNPLVTWQKFVG